MKMNRSTLLLLLAGLVVTVGTAASGPTAAQVGPPRALTFMESVKGTEEIELRWPVAVAAASAEEFAVADAYGPRLLRFRRVGVSWQLDGSAPLPGVPRDLSWDGERYVASLRQGKGLVALEGPELTPEQLPLPPEVVPGPLAVHANGDLLLGDVARHRVLRLSSAGEVRSEVEVPAGITALAATPAGGFLAAVAAEGAVLAFDAAGNQSATWTLPPSDLVPAWPVGLAVESGGDVFVVDRHGGRLLVLDATGQVIGQGSRWGWEPGLLHYPARLTRLPDGLIVVADEGNGRAQIFRRID